MSKTIKLEDAVYDKLTRLMGAKETYSQVVGKVLMMFDKLGALRDVLEGAIEYRKGQTERLDKNKSDTVKAQFARGMKGGDDDNR